MAGDDYVAPTKRLSPEEMEKHITRVTMPIQPVEVQDPFPVCPTVTMSQEGIDTVVERLYTQTLAEREATRKETEERLDNEQHTMSTHSKPLESDELQTSVDRLYTESIEHRRNNLAEIRERCDAEWKRKEPEPMPIRDYVQRMYFDQLEGQKKTEEKLRQEYIVPTEIRSAKMSRSRIANSADRLYGK